MYVSHRNRDSTDRFVRRHNIEHFSRLLKIATSKAERDRLSSLLAQEQKKQIDFGETIQRIRVLACAQRAKLQVRLRGGAGQLPEPGGEFGHPRHRSGPLPRACAVGCDVVAALIRNPPIKSAVINQSINIPTFFS